MVKTSPLWMVGSTMMNMEV